MPVKENPTRDVKCRCGKTTTVNIEPAIAYCKTTRFVCECKKVVHITDYCNGCITYMFPSKEVDEAFLKMREEDEERKNKDRKRCTGRIADFYTFIDEIPVGTRLSTIEDCKKCDGMKGCGVSQHCLITEKQIQRKCFNHCPRCDAGENDIEWGEKDWSDESAWQDAVCKKCGCMFSEVYIYSCSEIDAPI